MVPLTVMVTGDVLEEILLLVEYLLAKVALHLRVKRERMIRLL